MIQSYFSDIRNQILAELELAETEICIAVCWFTNFRLFRSLCKIRSKGIIVKLIILNDNINNRPDGLKFQQFIELGGKFYYSSIDNPMHNKYCIIDNKVLINGSYNWTNYAESRNDENIMIIKEHSIIQTYINDFTRLTQKCKLVTSIEEDAITEMQENTIVEGVRIATGKELIIKSTKHFITSKLSLKSSLGENIHNDVYKVFLYKGTSVPISAIHTLTTIEDNQISCYTDIRTGEDDIGSKNEKIGDFDVEDIPPLPKGYAGLITTFSVDLYGILTVQVKIRETGKIMIQKFNVEHLLE